jgi:hypothetical protein
MGLKAQKVRRDQPVLMGSVAASRLTSRMAPSSTLEIQATAASALEAASSRSARLIIVNAGRVEGFGSLIKVAQVSARFA